MKRSRTHLRRGSIYITTLGVSTLVLVIGMSAILIGRIDARTGATANDFAEARICARSGLELGMLTIYSDPYWRTHLGNGTWYSNKSIGNGAFSLSAVDPIDGDIPNGENDPVVLSSTGMKGSAKFITSMRMEVSPRVGSSLEVSMCSGSDTAISSGTLTSDQTISSNASVSAAANTVVNANVEAYRIIQGNGYTKTTKVTQLKRTLPDVAHVLDYYKANGTPISYASLPQFSSVELLSNTRFEVDKSGWYNIGVASLQLATNIYKEGLQSLRVTRRQNASCVAATDIPASSIVPGHSYDVNFPVYSNGSCNMQATLVLTTTAGSFSFSSPLTPVLQGTWTNVKTGNTPITPTWSGTVTKATIRVESDVNKDYFLDGLSFSDVSYKDGAYVMENVLLSPTSNPFGGQTNPKGIYVISGTTKQNVVISNCRIIGTLVLLGVNGANSGIFNSTIIEPAIANFPALLTDSQIDISLSSNALDEAALGQNFNPAGAPYPYVAGLGTYTNTTATDSYPPGLNGLVYSTVAMSLDNTNVNGVVICASKITTTGAIGLKYNNTYLTNPPPGFILGTVQMTPLPGTWQRKAGP